MVEERPGYLETVGGALIGGFVIGVGMLVIGFFAIGAVVGALLEGDTGGRFAALLVLQISLGPLGLWLGALAGAFVALRWRGFREPRQTVLPMVYLIPLIGLLVFLITTTVMENAPSIGGEADLFIRSSVLYLLVVGIPALVARAVARWRETGHL